MNERTYPFGAQGPMPNLQDSDAGNLAVNLGKVMKKKNYAPPVNLAGGVQKKEREGGLKAVLN